MSDTEKQAKPEDTTEFIAQVRKNFQRCIEATSENRRFQFDDLRFAAGSPDNGWQWPPDVLAKRLKDPNGARPTLTISKISQHIRLVTNEQRKNKPMGKVLPVDSKSDVEVAEVLNDVIRHIEVASHADIAYDTACESQVTIGEGYWRIVTDYMDDRSQDQDICIDTVKNAFSVYMDPDGLKRDAVGRLCEYAFITEKMPTARYESEFPNAKSRVDWDDLQIGDDTFDWFDDEGVMVAEYFYIEKKEHKITFWSDGSTTIDDEIPKVIGLTPTGERKTTLKSVKWCKVNGLEVLEESDWAGKYIPIVRIVGNEWNVEGQLVTAGIVRNAKDPCRMINYWASQEAEMLALAPKAPWLAAVGQLEGQEDIWRDSNVTNYAYLQYNPIDVNGAMVPPPQRVGPPMIMSGLIEAKRGASDDLQATVGQYNPSLGADAKEKSGRAIMARQQQADVGTYHYTDNLSRGIGYSTEIILDLIPKIYDTRRVVRIIGEDGTPDQATLSVGQGQAVTQEEDEKGAIQKIYDPSVGIYDVVVSVGPSFSTKRMESQEFLTQAAQAAKDPTTSQILSYLALKTADWPEADEAADMIKKMLPPQVLVDENANQNDPAQQKMQLQQAASALGQKEAALNHAHDQVAQAAQQATHQEQMAKDQEQKANDAMVRVQSKIGELNAQQETLNQSKRELEMQQRLTLAEIENKRLAGLLQVTEAKAKAEKAISDQQDAPIVAGINEIKTKLDQFEVAAPTSGAMQ